VIFFDTECTRPIGLVTGIHYEALSDMAWGADGRSIYVSSLDGYVSAVRFESLELGVPLGYEDDLFPGAMLDFRVQDASSYHDTPVFQAKQVTRVVPRKKINRSITVGCVSENK